MVGRTFLSAVLIPRWPNAGKNASDRYVRLHGASQMARLGFCGIARFLPLAALGQSPEDKTPCTIIYVPTPQVVVDKMLELAKVKKEDIVYDLGCGDGRIVCTAAKKHGATGVGVDIDPARI